MKHRGLVAPSFLPVPRGWAHAHGALLIELLKLTDAASLFIALGLAALWTHAPWDKGFVVPGLLVVALFFLAARRLSLYRSWRSASVVDETGRAIACTGIALTAATALIHVLDPWPWLPRTLPLNWGLIAIGLLTVSRLAARLGLRALRRRGGNFRRAAIVGSGETARLLDSHLDRQPWMGIRVVSHHDPDSDDLSGLFERVHAGEVDIVYLALPLGDEGRIRAVARQLRNGVAAVYFVADFSSLCVLRGRWESMGDIAALSLVESPHTGIDGLLKRCFDVVLSLAGLALLAVPMALVGLAVRLDSPGPILFRQRRYGLDGSTFQIYKFRTMRAAGEDSPFVQARRHDDRVTRFGAWLRRTSLDELPQLINVFQGRMSLVGPRPHPIALDNAHREAIEGYSLRHRVRPGITGWAQIHGCRGETDTPEKMQERVHYDIEYINGWTFGLDLRILWATLWIAFNDPNAY